MRQVPKSRKTPHDPNQLALIRLLHKPIDIDTLGAVATKILAAPN
jgi:hypothetical protein